MFNDGYLSSNIIVNDDQLSSIEISFLYVMIGKTEIKRNNMHSDFNIRLEDLSKQQVICMH